MARFFQTVFDCSQQHKLMPEICLNRYLYQIRQTRIPSDIKYGYKECHYPYLMINANSCL